ncbi:MAG TPA: hypothetical protein VEL73_05150, partial [Mycobacteriales bacterium]|nr:hypothetical protein [Mycobacteriales bacterium]
SADRDSAGRAGADRGRTDPDSGDRDSGDRDEAGAPAGQGSGQDDAKTSGGRAQDAGDSAEPAERSDVGRR